MYAQQPKSIFCFPFSPAVWKVSFFFRVELMLIRINSIFWVRLLQLAHNWRIDNCCDLCKVLEASQENLIYDKKSLWFDNEKRNGTSQMILVIDREYRAVVHMFSLTEWFRKEGKLLTCYWFLVQYLLIASVFPLSISSFLQMSEIYCFLLIPLSC